MNPEKLSGRPYLIFCPHCGEQSLLGEGSNRFFCDRCGCEFFLNVAAAVAVFVTDAQGRILLIRREKDPGKGLLSLPGGFADSAESAEAAARREVREETGVELGDLAYLVSLPNTYPYKEIQYNTLDIFFIAPMVSQNPDSALDDVTEILFRDPFTIRSDELAFDSVRGAFSVYRRTRS